MSPKKIALIIFAAALLMRIASLASFAEEKSLFYVNDSYTYIQVAKNILGHGVYSMEISNTPHADNFRTPLYPLFLLPFVWLKVSFYIPAMLQNIIMAAGIGLFYWYSRKIWGEWPARISSFLFALEPFSALISSQILTEAIFTPLFTLAILYIVNYIKTKELRNLGYGSILLALAALARPAAFYLFLTFPLAIIFTKPTIRIFFKQSIIALGIFFLVVSPWLYFIIFKLHTFSFSSIVKMQVYEYHGRYFDNWRASKNPNLTDRLPILDLNPINDTLDARAIPPVQAVGEAYLKDHFSEYLYFHFIRTPRLFTDSGYASILNGIPFLHFNYDSVKGGFVDQFNNLNETISTIKKEPLFVVLLVADLLFILITILAFINPLLHYYHYKTWPQETLYILALLTLYAVIVSPIGGARFRIPINPFLFILGLDTLKKILSSEQRKPSSLVKASHDATG